MDFKQSYAMANMLIITVIPLLVYVLLLKVVERIIASWIMAILMLICSQIIWRLCSEFIYDKLLRGFSHNHLSLSD